MILGVVRPLKSLSVRHYIVILFTIFFPTIVPSLVSSGIGGLVLVVFVYLVWPAIVVLSVASMLKGDKSKAEQSVDQKLKGLSSELQLLKEEHKRTTAGLKDQVTEIDRVMRSAFEELGVVLPPRRTLLRADMVGGAASGGAALSVRSPKRLVRFRHWVWRHALRFWRWFYG